MCIVFLCVFRKKYKDTLSNQQLSNLLPNSDVSTNKDPATVWFPPVAGSIDFCFWLCRRLHPSFLQLGFHPPIFMNKLGRKFKLHNIIKKFPRQVEELALPIVSGKCGKSAVNKQRRCTEIKVFCSFSFVFIVTADWRSLITSSSSSRLKNWLHPLFVAQHQWMKTSIILRFLWPTFSCDTFGRKPDLCLSVIWLFGGDGHLVSL